MKLAVDVVEITYEIGCGCPQSFFCGTIFAVYLPQIGTFVVDKRNAPNRNFCGEHQFAPNRNFCGLPQIGTFVVLKHSGMVVTKTPTS